MKANVRIVGNPEKGAEPIDLIPLIIKKVTLRAPNAVGI